METLVANTPFYFESKNPSGSYIHLLGETYYRIANYDLIPPFLMSLVSSADHWLFISSTGGLTAGRIDANSALFPYETEDKIAAHSELTGGKTIVRATRNGRTYLWEPFSERYAGLYRCERHLYKNVYGNKLIFEEVNQDLKLTLRVGWFTGPRFGFIRQCWLYNNADRSCQVELLDGMQNLLPSGANNTLQNTLSSLLNAYKRNELDSSSGLGIYALSATLSDRAEPSESLQATVAWQVGLDNACYLLSTDQMNAFRRGQSLSPETDLRGKAGAYLVNASLELPANGKQHWIVVADVNQDHPAVVRLEHLLEQDKSIIESKIENDICRGTADLVKFVAAADGLQKTAEDKTTAHHFANVLFNVLRGGIFADNYTVDRDDLLDFVAARNRPVLSAQADWFSDLPDDISIRELYSRASESTFPDLIRLCYEYLPLTFSRRHGDPSRPWNSFSINLRKRDGSPRLDYQGNWRDIFQNWESLLYSFPHFVEGILAKFLNATTADGYNPYRITRDGIEWEIPQPDNPWSNIGYWSDHQIIYLQKLLEIAEKFQPGSLKALWTSPIFAYADVPYRLRAYDEMLANWHDTIDFDWKHENETEQAVSTMGTDGRLVRSLDSKVILVNMTEKLLVLLLAKLTNLVPEGGIWMNTQRPEWNDANNALVGKGLSVVTLAYLYRFLVFWHRQLELSEEEMFDVNSALAALLDRVQEVFDVHKIQLESGFTDRTRRQVMDTLGQAATGYRNLIYQKGFPFTQTQLSRRTLQDFLTTALAYVEQTLRANRREDGLFHSYNVLRLDESEAAVENLYLMLEGQVAILSSGLLDSETALSLLRNLRHSELYRPDQHTYMLYPNREIPGFRQKNYVAADQVDGSELVAALTAANDLRLLVRDEDGVYHFNGLFHNAADVVNVLENLAQEPAYTDLIAAERDFILDLFETTFNHRAFTGRSGTFFAYEGLGSVYWHMVSKLLIAAQECYLRAVDEGSDDEIISRFYSAYNDIRTGLGFNKEPIEYGAFPTDPYSHTPMGGGARQPGMTGQVKEEILTRFGELGISVEDGALKFKPTLLMSVEFLSEADDFSYYDVEAKQKTMPLSPGSLAFTFCQTPVIYKLGDRSEIVVQYADGRVATVQGSSLDPATSQHIFGRDGIVEMLQVMLKR